MMLKKVICNHNLLHSWRTNNAPKTAVAAALSRLLSTTSSQTAADQAREDDSNTVLMDWDTLSFSLVPTDYMYTMNSHHHYDDIVFEEGQLSHYGSIEISPAAGVLNYGQGVFEGLKAYRRKDGGIALFRPDQNAMRMRIGAERMCMPSPSIDQFINAVKLTTLANKRWIPPMEKGALYLRPLLIGTGSMLGVGPAPEYSFIVYASPVGKYFKDGKALDLYVESEYDRASQGGVGGIKSITNYAPGLKPLMRAKSRGFSDVLYLDSATGKYIEEASSSNIFIVKDGVISTPIPNGTILPGITRKSIMEIATDHGFETKERLIGVDEVMEADEVFCTGTAAVVVPVGSITYKDQRIVYQADENSAYQRLSSVLVGIQRGAIEDNKGWMVEI